MITTKPHAGRAGDSSNFESTGLINYQSFLYGYGLICVNFHRLRLSEVNAPCSIMFNSSIDTSKLNAASFDLYFLVERLNTLTIKLSSSDVISIVKAGS